MKLNWHSLFGSGEVELPSVPIWRTTTRISAPFNCTTETRMVTDDDGSKVELIFRDDRDGATTVTFQEVENLDRLVAELIKMRDLLEKAKPTETSQ